MEPTRRGKIARLPRAIREELNHRLDEGDPQKDLVGWLNSLPEVKSVLQAQFEGKAITAQNLSEWKQGGYRDWRAQLEALEIARCLREDSSAGQGESEGQPPLVDALTFWLTVRLAAETRGIVEAEPEEGWKRLRQFSRELAVLRRGDLQKQRLELERQREQRKAEEGRRNRQPAGAAADSSNPEVAEEDRPTRAEKIALLRKAFFADVDNAIPLNLPPRPGEPGYQPGIISDGVHWYDGKGGIIPSPKDEIIRKAIEAKKAWEEAQRIAKEEVAALEG